MIEFSALVDIHKNAVESSDLDCPVTVQIIYIPLRSVSDSRKKKPSVAQQLTQPSFTSITFLLFFSSSWLLFPFLFTTDQNGEERRS